MKNSYDTADSTAHDIRFWYFKYLVNWCANIYAKTHLEIERQMMSKLKVKLKSMFQFWLFISQCIHYSVVLFFFIGIFHLSKWWLLHLCTGKVPTYYAEVKTYPTFQYFNVPEFNAMVGVKYIKFSAFLGRFTYLIQKHSSGRSSTNLPLENKSWNI